MGEGAKGPLTYQFAAVRVWESRDGLPGPESWLLLRQSGTEPVLRVYSEATSQEKREALLDEGVALVKRGLR